MRRRDFLATTAAAVVGGYSWRRAAAEPPQNPATASTPPRCCGMIYASPQAAMQAPPETLAYVTATYVGTPQKQPDFLATVDLDPKSPTYTQVIHQTPMPRVGDELHHFGWNTCGSCHADPQAARRYLIVPGFRSNQIHILDGIEPRAPKRIKTIEAQEIVDKTNLSAPHTVHCLPTGEVMISMLGDGAGNSPGGFLMLDQQFNVAGRWLPEAADAPRFNYDYWYQPRHNVMVSSEWAAPNTFQGGFNLDDVQAGKYGDRLHFWDWQGRKLLKTFEFGETGRIPLEVRFHHNPDSTHGYVGAALSSTVWHWHQDGGEWRIEKVIEVPGVEVEGWPFPVPGLITDQLVSLDDRWLYFSNWLHGDIRQYDIRAPAKPRLASQVWIGGLLGKAQQVRGRTLCGGPQMLQLSLDGRRLYVTNSLYSSWDNQFYPKIAEEGSYMLRIDCDREQGGMTVHEDFLVDFGRVATGPVRAHEIRFPDGDSTSDIWI